MIAGLAIRRSNIPVVRLVLHSIGVRIPLLCPSRTLTRQSAPCLESSLHHQGVPPSSPSAYLHHDLAPGTMALQTPGMPDFIGPLSIVLFPQPTHRAWINSRSPWMVPVPSAIAFLPAAYRRGAKRSVLKSRSQVSGQRICKCRFHKRAIGARI